MSLLKISAERVDAAAILYHDNITMALMKREGPGSKRSRHINIQHFESHVGECTNQVVQ